MCRHLVRITQIRNRTRHTEAVIETAKWSKPSKNIKPRRRTFAFSRLAYEAGNQNQHSAEIWAVKRQPKVCYVCVVGFSPTTLAQCVLLSATSNHFRRLRSTYYHKAVLPKCSAEVWKNIFLRCTSRGWWRRRSPFWSRVDAQKWVPGAPGL